MSDNVSMPEATIPGRNGGRLNNGGTPGNKGGPGTPPSKIRELCREHFYNGIPKMAELVLSESEGTSNTDRIRAQDLFGKYGLGDASPLENEEVIRRCTKVILQTFPNLTEGEIKTLADGFTKEFS